MLEPIALAIFGTITAKTVPVILDFLGNRLKGVLDGKMSKGKREVEALKNEVENLRRQLEVREAIGVNEVRQVEAQIQRALLVQQKHGLELISDQAHKRWILEQFEKLGEIKSSQGNFKIDVWTQEGTSSTPRDVTIVPITTTGSYRIGNNITFFFRSNHDCYLTLFNLGTSDAITILFPNRLFPDNFIRADCTYSMPGEGYPFEYRLNGPAGTERIQAIASVGRVDLADLDFSEKDKAFYSVERSAAAKDIQIVEKRMKELPLTCWATATCKFYVR